MSHAGSHANGGSQLGYHAAAHERVLEAPAHVLLPPPAPRKLHWSTMVLVGGLITCTLALLATLAGVPAKMGYDVDGPANMNKPTSSDPMALNRSIDGNMKWIAQNSGDTPTTYLGLTRSINRNEAAIAGMMQAMVIMNSSVAAIEAGMGDVGAAAARMRADMDAMAATSSTSAAAMTSLGSDIGFLSGSMLELANSTKELTERMASIEQQADSIASGGTSEARKNAADLNASLPDEVPVPLTDEGRPLSSYDMGEIQ